MIMGTGMVILRAAIGSGGIHKRAVEDHTLALPGQAKEAEAATGKEKVRGAYDFLQQFEEDLQKSSQERSEGSHNFRLTTEAPW